MQSDVMYIIQLEESLLWTSLWFGKNKGLHTFPKGINLKVNIIAWLELEPFMMSQSSILAITLQWLYHLRTSLWGNKQLTQLEQLKALTEKKHLKNRVWYFHLEKRERFSTCPEKPDRKMSVVMYNGWLWTTFDTSIVPTTLPSISSVSYSGQIPRILITIHSYLYYIKDLDDKKKNKSQLLRKITVINSTQNSSQMLATERKSNPFIDK